VPHVSNSAFQPDVKQARNKNASRVPTTAPSAATHPPANNANRAQERDPLRKAVCDESILEFRYVENLTLNPKKPGNWRILIIRMEKDYAIGVSLDHDGVYGSVPNVVERFDELVTVGKILTAHGQEVRDSNQFSFTVISIYDDASVKSNVRERESDNKFIFEAGFLSGFLLGQPASASSTGTDKVIQSTLGLVLFPKAALERRAQFDAEGKSYQFIAQLMRRHPSRANWVAASKSFKETQSTGNQPEPTNDFNMKFENTH